MFNEAKRTRRTVERLQHRRRGSLPISNDNVSNPPTDAQLDSAFGDAATLPNGFAALVNDAGGAGTGVWFVTVVNDAWYYEQLTQAV